MTTDPEKLAIYDQDWDEPWLEEGYREEAERLAEHIARAQDAMHRPLLLPVDDLFLSRAELIRNARQRRG